MPGSQVIGSLLDWNREAFWPWEIRYHILVGELFRERTLCGHKWCHPWRTIYADPNAPTCGKCKERKNG